MIVSGNTCVVVSSYDRPLPAVTFSEVLATSDVPGGVVNMLTGVGETSGPWLASHMDVNAIDLVGAGRLRRARRPSSRWPRRTTSSASAGRPRAEPDWTEEPELSAMTAYLETKTVWHPIGV